MSGIQVFKDSEIAVSYFYGWVNGKVKFKRVNCYKDDNLEEKMKYY